MHRVAFALAAVVFGTAAIGCDDSFRTLTIDSQSEATVPGGTLAGNNPLAPDVVFPADVISQALAQSIAQSFSTESVNKAAVDSLKLTAFSVDAKDPQNSRGAQIHDLGVLNSMAIFLGSDAADPVEVAASEAAAFDGDPAPTHYDFPVSGAELVDILNSADTMDMTADVEPGEPPNFETTLVFRVELTVVANLLGVITGG